MTDRLEISPAQVAADAPPWRVLVVDDDADVHEATEFALQGVPILGRPVAIEHASSAADALRLLSQSDEPAAILLDVVMETEDAGLELVSRIRDELKLLRPRIILRTGQPGRAPELDTVSKYDINDYKTKNELTRSKLCTTLTAALRSYDQLRRIDASRQALERIVQASQWFLADDARESFTEGVVTQIAQFIGIEPEGLVCARPARRGDGLPDPVVVAAAGEGRHLLDKHLSAVADREVADALAACLAQRRTIVAERSLTLHFAGARADEDFAAYLASNRPLLEVDRQLLEAFRNSFAAAGRGVGRNLQAIRQHAQKMESLGQLTGGIAHDFNNLLTVIMGNAELLAEALHGEPTLGPLADMTCAAAARGAELTHRLLAFSRRQPLDARDTDVNALLAGMNALLRRTLREDVEIEMVHAAGLWHATVDPSELEAALLNLCINARDAMPAGGRLTLETANAFLSDDYARQHGDVVPGQYVMIAVSDTGSGIAPEHLLRVFEPFFTTKEPGKGTGLGLSMVYGFVKQSRGHVKVYSESGQGTTIKLYLPRGDGSGAPRDTDVSGDEPRGVETVLLVEDEDMVRAYARDQLLALGYQVLAAADGAQALALLDSRSDIALLFTDIVLPGGLNGRQVAEAALQRRPGLKVLYTSGYSENAIVHHGRLDRGVQLLNKPYRRIDLARKVRAVLDAP